MTMLELLVVIKKDILLQTWLIQCIYALNIVCSEMQVQCIFINIPKPYFPLPHKFSLYMGTEMIPNYATSIFNG